MNADLERLIALQRLDSAAHDAGRRVAEAPAREKALDERMAAALEHVAAMKERLAESLNARRALEKDVAMHQGRLSKFREQAMAVKTNQEYHAVQKEIEFAQHEVKALEDKVLERMLEGDELAAGVKRTEAELAGEQKKVDAERKAMAAEIGELNAALAKIGAERKEIVGSLAPPVLHTFEQVSRKRNGVAMSEARAGICTICHVRLRPQIFNNVRLNGEIIQCDHCNRILYFVPAAAPSAGGADQPAP